jgi:pheromone shutdown protein TraB
MSLEKEIIKLIEKKGKVTFNELLNYFNNKEEIIKTLNKLEEDEKITIETYLPKETSFVEYLKDLSYTLWFYLTILVIILTNLFVFIIPNVYPYNIFRWIFFSHIYSLFTWFYYNRSPIPI